MEKLLKGRKRNRTGKVTYYDTQNDEYRERVVLLMAIHLETTVKGQRALGKLETATKSKLPRNVSVTLVHLIV